MLAFFGISVFVSILVGVLWSTSRHWRALAEHYASPDARSSEVRHMQNAVLIGLGSFKSLKGIVSIGVNDAGVSLRVMPLFSLFHEPLFIPHSDIQGWSTSWYLDGESTELQFRSTPDIKMVVPTETAEWIKGYAGHQMVLKSIEPPSGKAGQGWRLLLLVHASMALMMLGWLAHMFLFQAFI